MNHLCICVYYRFQRLLYAYVNGPLSFHTASLHLNKMTQSTTCHRKITITIEVSKEKRKCVYMYDENFIYDFKDDTMFDTCRSFYTLCKYIDNVYTISICNQYSSFFYFSYDISFFYINALFICQRSIKLWVSGKEKVIKTK
jgi:hypothetical protein